MRMVVTVPKARVYGKVLRAGDEFECPDKEARLWRALARANSAPRNVASQIVTAAVEPGPDIVEADDEQVRRRRGRTYSRRDMRAED
jgi:hypothetical protein